MDWTDPVTSDELRRAFVVAFVANAGTDAGPRIEDALAARFPDDRIDALMARVLLMFLWLETDQADELAGPASPLGVPAIHPAVYDVAATYPIQSGSIPKPRPFFRALEKRVRLYDTVARLPE